MKKYELCQETVEDIDLYLGWAMQAIVDAIHDPDPKAAKLQALDALGYLCSVDTHLYDVPGFREGAPDGQKQAQGIKELYEQITDEPYWC